MKQQTIAQPISIAGTGLHSGAPVRLRLCPAAADHGISFVRLDYMQGDQVIAVHPGNWMEANLCTVLRNSDGASVSTIEHLLAALHGCGIHNLRIEIDGPEVPILDGSAAPFVTRILAAGLKSCDAPVRVLRVLRPVSVERDGARASLSPAPVLELAFEIDFADKAIGHQSRALEMCNGTFLRELSDCRTFCMRADVEMMQANGLALGGTLDNAVVFDQGNVLTPGGLRRADEPVRHKMLDAMGDLYVAGYPVIGRYEGIKAGHALTGQLLQALFADPQNYEITPCDAQNIARLPGANLSKKDMPLSA
ncbi:UDP-3-O-acyl-N-acetylglucosamine deacetylase [Roseinatronobacter alkalisoli]|uniref:UDP-3-O-acyl-N-acetylglucosamine deacetylase n=1 Tax=Roseinatronobacter alkalisoli TaxID=3028235 RepID=A0ABT5T4N3_9RHOB|nr:UDP-3-O-acyl-N-acetylglucosamine deacetylase [Roseinatronobacter sp. HJB301]MDD7970078.1 UDP-3-O-acyl-N-acetylglucosamine deacetylase [Roseinatronobacter sp. HJB301]